jgi:hypothetical protein
MAQAATRRATTAITDARAEEDGKKANELATNDCGRLWDGVGDDIRMFLIYRGSPIPMILVGRWMGGIGPSRLSKAIVAPPATAGN